VIQYHKLKGKPEVEKTGVIDSVPDFLRDMSKLSPDMQRATLSIHLLSLLLDGKLERKEHRFLREVMGECTPAARVSYMEARLDDLCLRFSNLGDTNPP